LEINLEHILIYLGDVGDFWWIDEGSPSRRTFVCQMCRKLPLIPIGTFHISVKDSVNLPHVNLSRIGVDYPEAIDSLEIFLFLSLWRYSYSCRR